MTEICQVKKVKRKVAYIELKRKDECNGCNICSFNKKNSMTVPALCDIAVAVGDSVEVEMPQKSVGSGSLLIYAVPILLMLIGALIGLVGGMWLQIGLCAGGLVLGFVAAFFIDKAYRKKPDVMPCVLKIADNAVLETVADTEQAPAAEEQVPSTQEEIPTEEEQDKDTAKDTDAELETGD